MSIFNVNIYIKSKTFVIQRVIFRFLPNLRRLNKITKIVKSTYLKTNLKSNKTINKTVIK